MPGRALPNDVPRKRTEHTWSAQDDRKNDGELLKNAQKLFELPAQKMKVLEALSCQILRKWGIGLIRKRLVLALRALQKI